jgi:F-type H+-transporting ATPase subunit a
MLLAEFNPLEHVVAHELFRFEVFGYTVIFSNHMFIITLAALLLMIFLPLSLRCKSLVRTGFGNLIEAVCMFVREDVARPFLGEHTDKHIGFIWTLFFFVLSLNLFGMVPLGRIIYLFTRKGVHLEGAATANIWVTGTLAFISFCMIHIAGVRQHGLFGYIKNFAPSVPWPMVPFIYFMEIIGAIVKPFALAIRLFANMFAGHILLATVLAFIFIFQDYLAAFAAIAAEVATSFLEIFVAFLQAYIFTFLSAIFIGFAVNPEH